MTALYNDLYPVGPSETAAVNNSRVSTPRSAESKKGQEQDDEELKVDCCCGYNEVCRISTSPKILHD